jgi:hypothetical protein
MNWEIVLSIVAIALSIYALYQTHRLKEMEVRPWFTIDSIERFEVGDKQRLKANIKHVSGGLALNLRFSVAIGNASSSETAEAPAILPGDNIQLLSDLIAGPKIEDKQPIKWTFTFDDELGNRYRIEQTVSLKGKLISYVPKGSSRGLTIRWSGRVRDKVPSSYICARAAQHNR